MTCEWLKNEHIKIVNTIVEKINSIEIPQNAVMIFDIDQTLLDKNNNPIMPVVNLFHFVKQKGIHPVIITARLGFDANIQKTREDLAKHNVLSALLIYFLPMGKDPRNYKLMARKNVHERGFTVIMSIGDQPWDIGDYGGLGFLLPTCGCV